MFKLKQNSVKVFWIFSIFSTGSRDGNISQWHMWCPYSVWNNSGNLFWWETISSKAATICLCQKCPWTLWWSYGDSRTGPIELVQMFHKKFVGLIVLSFSIDWETTCSYFERRSTIPGKLVHIEFSLIFVFKNVFSFFHTMEMGVINILLF